MITGQGLISEVNFILLCWLVCWTIITERRTWYLKAALEQTIQSELSVLRDKLNNNSDYIESLTTMIKETRTKVEQMCSHD